jgi:hypothetical protein
MLTFLERYRSGEHVQVWNELVALGEGVRHELYYADAVAVAAETMRRARHNVELLLERLADAQYRFITPSDEYLLEIYSPKPKPSPELVALSQAAHRGTIWASQDPAAMAERRARRAAVDAERKAALEAKMAKALNTPPLQNPDVFDPPGPQTAALLDKLEEAAGGPMPISLRAWYEQVGGVSLNGSHPAINPKESAGPSFPADPLEVAPLRELVNMIGIEEGENKIGLWIAPDDLHKANVSGGEPYTITIPNASADAVFEYEWHNTTFVKYLRIAFQWGGFPGWEREKNPPREAIAKLSEGLLPL